MAEKTVAGEYAIIQTGGKQYQAIPGKTIAVEKLTGNDGDTISFDKVLMRKSSDGSVEFGKPFLEKPVTASIVKHIKDKKLVVFRFKRRKKVRVKKGHRQPITVLRIQEI